MMAFRQAGIYLPHFSGAQYDAGTPISVGSARRGDLMFWSSNGRPSGIHHVAIYLGGGQVIEAPRAGTQVRIRSLDYWYPDLAARL
jgi:cell wall-associated NlpC family hydrolase